MFKRILAWLALLLGGAMLFASSAGSCVADVLRDASDELADFADDVDQQDDDDDFWDWLEDMPT